MSAELLVGPDAAGRTVAIAHGHVVAPDALGPHAAHLPCPDGRIEPGRVNAHTHLYSGLAPLGMPAPEPPPETFLQILERVWWRLDRALDADSLRAAARYYAAEALLQGTTTLIDHHESPDFIEGSLDVLAEALDEVGARGLLCYGATDRNGGHDEGRRGLDECRRFVEADHFSAVRGLVGLHASFTVGDDTLREAAALCGYLAVPMHVHVAEAASDVEDARQRGCDGPLERLLDLGALPAGSIVAHGVHLSEAQVQRADEAGCWLVHNPRSNEGNRVGYGASLVASSRVALGTDGWEADMDAEVAAGERLASAHSVDPATARTRLDAGHRLVAERFGAATEPLTPGALGDLVVRNAAGSVEHVVVDGWIVVRGGSLCTADAGRVRSEARTAATALWERMNAL